MADKRQQNSLPKQEASGRPPGQSPNKDGANVKRFWHKVKETIGIANKTEYPKALVQSFDEIDGYFKAVETLVESLSNSIQPNPEFYKFGDPKIHVEAAAGQDEFEVMIAFLLATKKDFEDYSVYKQIMDIYSHMAVEHRKFQMEARKSLHFMRTFVRYDYKVLEQYRIELNQKREEMDFARQELNAAKDQKTIEERSKIKDAAVNQYNEKIKIVQAELKKFPGHREEHVKEVVAWGEEMKKYHEKERIYLDQIKEINKKK